MRIVGIVLGATVAGALGWAGWWYALALGQQAALAAWFDDRARAGWQAEHGEIALGGFPGEVRRRVEAIELADPRAGWAWTAPWLGIENAAFRPGRFAVAWPGRQRLAIPGELTEITSERMTATLELRPEPALGLVMADAVTEGLRLASQAGWTAGAARLRASVSARANDAGYDVTLIAEQALMPEPMMARIDPLGFAGREIERITLDGTAMFRQPLDRRVVEDGKLALKLADIRRAGFQWGELRLEARGRLAVDAAGFPEGKLDVTARHWREILAMAVRAEAIGPATAEATTAALELVALIGGDPDELDATLTFADREVWLGPVSLGPAPRLAPPEG